MKNKENFISIKSTIIIIFGIFISIFVLFNIGKMYEQKRTKQLTQKYEAEMNLYIEKNKDKVQKLFAESLPRSYKNCYETVPETNKSVFVCGDIKKAIEENFIDDGSLSNYSSTAFLKIDENKNLNLIGLNAISYNHDVDGYSSNNYEKHKDYFDKLVALLTSQTKEAVLVKSFFRSLAGYKNDSMQVVVPVIDKDGNVIGAFVRAIYE